MFVDFAQVNFWWLFLCCFTLASITWRLMAKLQKQFYTMGRVRQRFNIFDLQFTATPEELPKLLEGIDRLPNKTETKTSKDALRTQLYIDFLFMVGFYPLIFLLCLKTSVKMEYLGRQIFMLLACLQAIPFLCDILENCYLLTMLNKSKIPSILMHRFYQATVVTKWSIASLGIASAISALLYFWITGNYETSSLKFLLIGFIILIAVMAFTTDKTSKSQSDKPLRKINS